MIPRNPAPLAQRTAATKDGAPNEDGNEDCGEAAFAWCVRDLGNEPDCAPDEIHDEVLGQGALGGSDLLYGVAIHPAYAAAAKKRGLTLTPFFGTQAQLVARAHQALLSGSDALANFGGGSQYLAKFADPAHYSGFGHICAIAHTTAGGLMLMDPWIGDYRTYSDADLAQMIVWGYIVIASPDPAAVTTTAGGSSVASTPPQFDPTFFTLNSDGSYHCASTGHDIKGAVLDHYKNTNGLAELGLPLCDPIVVSDGTVAGKPYAALQVFERGGVADDAARTLDNPPNTVGQRCYRMHIEQGDVFAFLSKALADQLKAAQANTAAMQSQRDALSAKLAGVVTDVKKALSDAQ